LTEQVARAAYRAASGVTPEVAEHCDDNGRFTDLSSKGEKCSVQRRGRGEANGREWEWKYHEEAKGERRVGDESAAASE
jgi:hypothetical protein